VIEPTEEMVTAAAEVAEDEMIRRLGRDLGTIHRDDIIRAILAAVLAIVERDYERRRCDDPSWAGHRCTKPQGHPDGHHHRFSGTVWP
jgi:hypothetical protein